MIDNLSLTAQSGELIFLKGINGAGKTTLLKLIAGLHHPQNGAILWRGNDRVHTRQADLIFLTDQPLWDPVMTAGESLSYLRALTGVKQVESQRSPYINFELDRSIYTLSAGQKQRLLLTALLDHSRPLWLLDEPETALDETAQALLLEDIKTHCLNQNGLVIWATHRNSAELMDLQTTDDNTIKIREVYL